MITLNILQINFLALLPHKVFLENLKHYILILNCYNCDPLCYHLIINLIFYSCSLVFFKNIFCPLESYCPTFFDQKLGGFLQKIWINIIGYTACDFTTSLNSFSLIPIFFKNKSRLFGLFHDQCFFY